METEPEQVNELLKRFNDLNWSYADLAREVIVQKSGNSLPEKESKLAATRLKSSLIRILKNPKTGTLENVSLIAKAMGGEIRYSWIDAKYLKKD
jgi:hypothetical protein